MHLFFRQNSLAPPLNEKKRRKMRVEKKGGTGMHMNFAGPLIYLIKKE